MNRRRVAYICADTGVPVFGSKGCSIHVQEVIRALLRAKWDVDLFATRIDGNVPRGLENVTLHRLPPCPKGELAKREQDCLSANVALRETLDANGPYDLVYERYSLWSYGAMPWAADSCVPRVLEVNAPLIDEQLAHRGLIDAQSANRVATEVMSLADSIVAVSDGLRPWIATFAGKADPIHVIPNGVDPRRFADSDPPPRDTCTLGFIGTLKPWHGVEFLIDVFGDLHAQDPTWRLLIVGDGPQRQSVERNVRDRGLDRGVTFTGAVSAELVPQMLAEMDIAAAPYPQLDSFYFSPMKLYEYMAARRAVVASRIGQIESVVRDGDNGLLCKPGDKQAWIKALKRLRHDEPLRRLLAANARECAISDHSWDSVISRILNSVDLGARAVLTAEGAAA